MSSEIIKVSHLGLRPYEAVLESMHRFTEQRTSLTNDEIWLVEHPAVYTFGTSIKREHLLHPTTIPVVESDRGGQITYHGPGQLIVYFLIDLKRLKCGVREFVVCMEKSVMSTLQDVGIPSHLKEGAPGVYVEQKKICSLGLRVRHGCTFHGLALNVNMDLTPFEDINPCGYAGMKMTQIKEFIPDVQLPMVAKMLIEHICLQLNLTPSFTEHVTHD